MKAPYILHSNPGVNTLVRCIVFWSLFILFLFLSNPVAPILGTQYSRLLYGLLGALSALLVTWLFLWNERRSFKEIGLTWQAGTVKRFVQGLLLGSAIFGMILLALLIFTPLQIQRNPKPFETAALPGYLALLPLSLMEEIAFRSYPFLKLQHRFGLRITQVIVAITFALYHVAGGQGLLSSFLGPGVYAFVFGLAAAWSGGIAVPFGIHAALNILQPLTGLRGDDGAVWILKPANDIAASSMAAPDTIGLLMQWVVLLSAVVITEYYIRKKGKSHPPDNPAQYGNEHYPDHSTMAYLQGPQPKSTQQPGK